ncbi:high frequency lysogenization protein HflD [Agaribacterium haliotis]|uniref:high frequency lysogenization protein HflD n=1 Tax=Agaribacterium haliotis TaxID=2013869 RepID=UPI001EFCB171|nr:high frequency lysogenization protein HflD [Agaribacterium haliotis]
MSNASYRDLCLALAGIMQASAQVEHIAKNGYLDTALFETAVKSLFIRTPAKVEDVYGGVSGVLNGLELLEQQLSQYKQAPSTDVFRYALGVMHIQKRLARKTKLLNVISERLENAERQAEMFGPTHDNLVSNIADIYSDTISTFQYRIQVTGNYNYLQQDRVAAQVRALLFAAIRSAMLWRQLGGSRLQLFFYRKQLVAASRELIDEAKKQQLSGAA